MGCTSAQMQDGSAAVGVKEKVFSVSREGLKESDGGRLRFLMELEFVLLLANPTYIHYLAQNRYFEDQKFVKYLNYLQYWRRPEYPHALFFLELLQDAQFRTAMAHPGNKELAHRQQFYFWQHYRNNRLVALDAEGRKDNEGKNESGLSASCGQTDSQIEQSVSKAGDSSTAPSARENGFSEPPPFVKRQRLS